MELKRCKNGHSYDPSITPECPECAAQAGHTIPLAQTNLNGGWDAPDAVGNTQPLQARKGGTVPVNPVSPLQWADERDYKSAGAVSDQYNPTLPLDYEKAPSIQPVTGWLVCIEGNSKGADYRIHSQNNFIGRGQHMDICITGDNTISAERAAVIAYDDRENMFFFGIGNGHNLVYVNGKVTLNTVVLQPFDELTIGETKLLFVPLCSERFTWNGR